MVELLPGARVREHDHGPYVEIPWQEEALGGHLRELTRYRHAVTARLDFVHGIGAKTAAQMKRRGTRTLRDVVYSYPQFSSQARRLHRAIRHRELRKLASIPGCRDIDLLYAYRRHELLFLDVESLGFYGDPVFLVGVGYFDPADTFHVRQFLARTFAEERAVCAAFTALLRRFKALVSFNGKTYDVQVLRERCLYYFDRDPFDLDRDPGRSAARYDFETGRWTAGDEVWGAEAREGEEAPATRPPFPTGAYHHIDLYHNARRAYGSDERYLLMPNFRLQTLEEWILKDPDCREGDIPSYYIPRVYEAFVEDPAGNAGAMRQIVVHNYLDVKNLVVLLEKTANCLLGGAARS